MGRAKTTSILVRDFWNFELNVLKYSRNCISQYILVAEVWHPKCTYIISLYLAKNYWKIYKNWLFCKEHELNKRINSFEIIVAFTSLLIKQFLRYFFTFLSLFCFSKKLWEKVYSSIYFVSGKTLLVHYQVHGQWTFGENFFQKYPKSLVDLCTWVV